MPPLHGQAAAVLPPALLGEACDAALRLPLVAVLQAPALVGEPRAAAAVQPALLAEPGAADAVPQPLVAMLHAPLLVVEPHGVVQEGLALPVEAVGEPRAVAAAPPVAAAGAAERREGAGLLLLLGPATIPARRAAGGQQAAQLQLVLPVAALAIPPCARNGRKSQRRTGGPRMRREGEWRPRN